jgi:hypothetical protein
MSGMAAAALYGWSVWPLFFTRAVGGASSGFYTAGYAYIADISSMDNRSQNFGAFGLAMGLAFMIGPIIAGLLGQVHAGYVCVYIGMCGMHLKLIPEMYIHTDIYLCLDPSCDPVGGNSGVHGGQHPVRAIRHGRIQERGAEAVAVGPPQSVPRVRHAPRQLLRSLHRYNTHTHTHAHAHAHTHTHHLTF